MLPLKRSRLFVLSFALLLFAIPLPAASGPTIHLVVDATQAPTKLLHTQMTLPAEPGPLTLYYPKWIPGEHGPDGPLGNVTGLKIFAKSKDIGWKRDLLDMFTFHVDVPKGVSSLDIKFDYIEPASSFVYSGGASASDKMLVISWNQNVLYPAGILAQDITFQATLKLPAGWKVGGALPVEKQDGETIEFKPVSLNRLVDSPVIAGQYFRAVDITPPGEAIHHEIDMAADSQAALEMKAELRQHYVRLVEETGKLFGARHYRDYHFLLSLSDHVAHFGLEHHESNDSRTEERGIVDPQQQGRTGGLLSHEFVHSWNGKFRRPEDLSTPYYEAPMKTDLLWVYEGLTTYLGDLLNERSGLETPEQFREGLAATAAELGPGRPGRTWRSLLDTAAGLNANGRPSGWTNWRRGSDYYPEGELVWLEADTLIRHETQGKKSLDDFCRLFYAGPNNGPELKTYTFEELVASLKQVAPYDWTSFFQERLNSNSPEAPVGGIENGGWKVVYTEVEPEGFKRSRRGPAGVRADYSLGLSLGDDGTVRDSIVGMPAFKGGITSGMKIVAVNARAFTPSVFHDALKATKDSTAPLELLVLNDDYYTTVSVDYHGGERYPHLVREEGKPDMLDDILKPLAKP
ncbi:MAG: M61 family metallopeptidase [Deltaproteobacteria bacterium]